MYNIYNIIYTHIIIYSSEISLSSSEENKCSFSQNNISISLLSLGSPRPKTNSSVDLEAIYVPEDELMLGSHENHMTCVPWVVDGCEDKGRYVVCLQHVR